MKKLIAVFLTAVLFAGCSFSSSTSSQTYNGITKEVSTTTVNGETKEEVVYKDEDGNVLDLKEGEKAFEEARAEVEEAE